MLNWKGLSGLALLFVLTAILPACDYININYPTPVIATLSPSTVVAGQPTFTLTVTGQKFVQGSTVTWDGLSLTTLFINSGDLSATVPASLIAAPSAPQIEVSTPQPGGGVSARLTFTVTPALSANPQITSLSPASVLAGAGAFTLNVYGHNFYNTSTVTIDGLNQTTSLSAGTGNPALQQLVASIPANLIATAGVLSVSVLNPLPGGGQAAAVSLPVNNPQPVISGISPTGVSVATSSQDITLSGTGFVPTSTVTINGNPRVATFTSSTSIAVTLIGADTGFAGIAQVQVTNPLPGGGASPPAMLSINGTTSNGGGLPEMVDLNTSGGVPNNGVESPSTSGLAISSTGLGVAFSSIATDLAPNDSNGAADVFLRDTCMAAGACTQTTIIASTAASGTQANADSLKPAMDLSGQYVAFTSQATDLNPTCPTPPGSDQSVTCNYSFNGTTRQVFLRDLGATPGTAGTPSSGVTTAVYLVSTGVDGNPANGDAYSPAISSDGRYVAFLSAATNLVSGSQSNGIVQVYLRDTCLGQTTDTCTPITYLISSPDGFTPGNQPSSQPVVSTSGTYVSFTSAATNLIPGIAPAGTQIYLNSTCIQSNITCTVPVVSLISSPDGVSPANGNNSESAMTPDGRYFAFVATADPTTVGGKPLQFPQVYLLDTCTGADLTTITTCTREFTLISTPDLTLTPSTQGNQLSEYPSISNEGQYVAFASRATNLVTGTTNGFENVFLRNTCLNFTASTAGGTAPTNCQPTTFLRSASEAGVLGNADSQLPQISNDGSTIAFFSTANNLVSNDTNIGFTDIFVTTACPMIQTFTVNGEITTPCPGPVTATSTTAGLSVPLELASVRDRAPSNLLSQAVIPNSARILGRR